MIYCSEQQEELNKNSRILQAMDGAHDTSTKHKVLEAVMIKYK